MTRTTHQPAPATRRNTAKAQAETHTPGAVDEQDRRGENGQVGDNTERRENLSAVRYAQDNDGDDSRQHRDDSRQNRDDERENRDDGRQNREDERGNRERRDNRDNRGGREVGKNRDERQQHDGDAEQGSRREPSPALFAGVDTFAPVLEAWKQVFTSWSELAQTMVKVQQDAFTSMIGAANAHAKDITLGDRRDGELVSSGSPTTALRSDRIEHDRR